MGEKIFSQKDTNVYEGRTVIECPECAFEFSVIHELSDKPGEYTCPLCEEERLKDENKRLREALEFYADEAMYEKKLVSKSLCPQIEPDEYTPAYIPRFDKGYRARQALGGDTN